MGNKSLSLREIQLAELKLLEAFDALCKAHSLRYYLIGGTLLGAYRHQGFIPWDDDVDVCMPRTDYERLMTMELRKTNMLPAGIEMIRGRDIQSAYAFSKIIDLNIYVEEIYSKDANQNLWIDIFPVDGVPNNRIHAKMLYQMVGLLQTLQGISLSKHGEGKTLFRKSIKQIIKPIVCLWKEKYKTAIEKLAQTCNFEEAKLVGVINGSLHGTAEIMDKELFLQSGMINFENQEFPVFGASEAYLYSLYGEYMRLPPESKRKRHIAKAWIGEKKQ